MADRQLPSPEVLRQLLRYEPETGKLFWLPRPRHMFPNDNIHRAWNTKYADQETMVDRSGKNYLRGRIEGQTYMAHRVIWAIYYGAWPSMQIDHIDRDRTNNRIANLRDVSCVVNSRNRGMPITNVSGVVGVRKIPGTGRYRVEIGGGGNKRVCVGNYATVREAAIARRAAEKVLGFSDPGLLPIEIAAYRGMQG